MTPATIIRAAQADGVKLAPSSVGMIKATGDRTAVNRWLTVIREHKAEIIALLAEPFDRDAFEERAGIVEFDAGLTRAEAEAVAWHEDDRRLCTHCLNLLPGGVCKVAAPGLPVSAMKGYRPIQDVLRRCLGYRPRHDDPDRRTGSERWPGLIWRGSD